MSLNQFETDEQRAEALLDWLRENSTFLVLLVVGSIALFIGIHYYKEQQIRAVEEASEAYNLFNRTLSGADPEAPEVLAAADALSEEKHPIYHSLAAIKVAQGANSGEIRRDQLISALEYEKDPIIRDLLYYRLSQLLYNEGAYEEALSYIEEISSSGYRGLAKNIAGDIYLKLEQPDKARLRYEEAIEAGKFTELTLYKLEALGGPL